MCTVTGSGWLFTAITYNIWWVHKSTEPIIRGTFVICHENCPLHVPTELFLWKQRCICKYCKHCAHILLGSTSYYSVYRFLKKIKKNTKRYIALPNQFLKPKWWEQTTYHSWLKYKSGAYKVIHLQANLYEVMIYKNSEHLVYIELL